uniref:Uncharacterized protein n=1 Tax=Rhizophora mucronata TaxID=61149 RepID=A0A2P2QN02_RHIMU
MIFYLYIVFSPHIVSVSVCQPRSQKGTYCQSLKLVSFSFFYFFVLYCCSCLDCTDIVLTSKSLKRNEIGIQLLIYI